MPRRTCTLRPDEVAALCGAPVVRTADLIGRGLNRSTVRHRCRPGGPWRALLPGIVLLSNSAPTRADRRRAALLYAGTGAVLTGLDALTLHGMERMPSASGPVHVLIPEDRRRVGAGRVLAERTNRLPVPGAGRWPLAPLARATLDFARRSTDRTEVRATIAEVVQRGRCTVAELAAELEAGCGRGSALPREVLREVGDGVRSVAEAKARELATRSGLPAPIWNAALFDAAGRFVAIPDAWFDEVGLAWEIDSTEWHLSPQAYERTLDRRSAMMAEGVTVMHTQPAKLANRPAETIDELQRTYHHAARTPRPAVIAVRQNGTDGPPGGVRERHSGAIGSPERAARAITGAEGQ